MKSGVESAKSGIVFRARLTFSNKDLYCWVLGHGRGRWLPARTLT